MAELLPKVRRYSDVHFKVTLSDSDVPVSWDSVTIQRLFMYSEKQKSFGGKASFQVGADPHELLVTWHAYSQQFLGVHRVVVQIELDGGVATYDAQACNVVASTSMDTDIEMEEIDVPIEVSEVDTTIMHEILEACQEATAEAHDAAVEAKASVAVLQGGQTGQVLTKHSDSPLDFEWKNAEGAVKYSESQSLTEAQKGVARTNIGAASAADVTELEQKVGIIPITYAELKALRDNGELVAGAQYRITDYHTTTVQENTQSADHQFDIIVIADDAAALNENARACLHAGDTYFSGAGAKLEAWKLKYSLDNDTDRFAWADADNGTGVIYYMKDEWNNECPYDFKNIQFKRKLTDGEYDPVSGTDTWVYTFNVTDGEVQIDATLVEWASVGIDYVPNRVFGNKLGCSQMSILIDDTPTCPFVLGDNVFLCVISDVQYNNCHSNTFGNGCYSNTFGNGFHDNIFGNGFHDNIFGSNCWGNTFGNDCSRNTFGDSCYNNTFGNCCGSNTFGDNSSKKHLEYTSGKTSGISGNTPEFWFNGEKKW